MIKFSEDIKNEILVEYSMKDLKGEGVNTAEDIARKYNYSIDNVCSILVGFDSSEYYEKDLLDKLDFQHLNNFQKWSFRQLSFSRGSKYLRHHAKELGFDSYEDFEGDLIKSLNFNSAGDFKKYLNKKLGFESLEEYNMNLAKENNVELKYL